MWPTSRASGLTGKRPIAHVEASWKAWRDHTDREFKLPDARDTRVAAVCGIGNPRPFLWTLKSCVGSLIHVHQFPDHHVYTAADLERTFASAKAGGAEAVVTTEKDWVKWRTVLKGPPPLPVFRPMVKIGFLRGSDALEALLARLANQAI
jgi:tetraacyldisaccharide 4'-kinase